MKTSKSSKDNEVETWPRSVQPGREIVKIYRRKTPAGNLNYMVANYVDGPQFHCEEVRDRWPQARQRLDFYHAVQHLAAVGRALLGQDKPRLRAWLKPLVKQLKNESAIKVISQLEAILADLPSGPAAQHKR